MANNSIYGIYYAKAVLSDGIVTGYTGGVKKMGDARSATFSPNTSSDSPLYANGSIVETCSSGGGGTLKTEMDELSQAVAADLYGLTVEKVTVTVDGEEVEGQSIKYTGAERSVPVGVGYIEEGQKNNVPRFFVMLFRRAVYDFPEHAAETRTGSSVTWKTPTINATITGMEGDGTNAWLDRAEFSTRAAAIKYIENYLNKEVVS